MKTFVTVFFIFATIFNPVYAETKAVYPFEKPQQEMRFNYIIKGMRCLVCQNQNLSESDASLAQDLKRIIYKMVKNNKSNNEIVGFLQARYGDFILFKPPFQPNTYLLWLLPMILLLLGIAVIRRIIRG